MPPSRTARLPLIGAVLALAVGAVVALVSLVACSNQHEGERCSLDGNGNDDCLDGLVCTSQRDLFGVNSDVCCPGDRTQATTGVCRITHAPVGGNPLPPDSGADSSPTSDGATPANDATADGG